MTVLTPTRTKLMEAPSQDFVLAITTDSTIGYLVPDTLVTGKYVDVPLDQLSEYVSEVTIPAAYPDAQLPEEIVIVVITTLTEEELSNKITEADSTLYLAYECVEALDGKAKSDAAIKVWIEELSSFEAVPIVEENQKTTKKKRNALQDMVHLIIMSSVSPPPNEVELDLVQTICLDLEKHSSNPAAAPVLNKYCPLMLRGFFKRPDSWKRKIPEKMIDWSLLLAMEYQAVSEGVVNPSLLLTLYDSTHFIPGIKPLPKILDWGMADRFAGLPLMDLVGDDIYVTGAVLTVVLRPTERELPNFITEVTRGDAQAFVVKVLTARDRGLKASVTVGSRRGRYIASYNNDVVSFNVQPGWPLIVVVKDLQMQQDLVLQVVQKYYPKAQLNKGIIEGAYRQILLYQGNQSTMLRAAFPSERGWISRTQDRLTIIVTPSFLAPEEASIYLSDSYDQLSPEVIEEELNHHRDLLSGAESKDILSTVGLEQSLKNTFALNAMV